MTLFEAFRGNIMNQMNAKRIANAFWDADEIESRNQADIDDAVRLLRNQGFVNDGSAITFLNAMKDT